MSYIPHGVKGVKSLRWRQPHKTRKQLADHYKKIRSTPKGRRALAKRVRVRTGIEVMKHYNG